jgi:uncharacterized DUF497 family protein
MGYEFEWSSRKASANVRKHGVSFEEAATVFANPLAMLMPDPDHSLSELRFLLLGDSAHGKLLVVSFAERPPRTRLISARRATRAERRAYEEGR